MIFPYPYFNFPYYHRPSRYGYYYPHPSTPMAKRPSVEPHTKNVGASIARPKQGNTQKKETSGGEDSPLFQIFGLNLYFDDILLVCLIWFLYQEGVKDEGLFMALILLLLS